MLSMRCCSRSRVSGTSSLRIACVLPPSPAVTLLALALSSLLDASVCHRPGLPVYWALLQMSEYVLVSVLCSLSYPPVRLLLAELCSSCGVLVDLLENLIILCSPKRRVFLDYVRSVHSHRRYPHRLCLHFYWVPARCRCCLGHRSRRFYLFLFPHVAQYAVVLQAPYLYPSFLTFP